MSDPKLHLPGWRLATGKVMQWHFFGIGRSVLTGIVLQE